MSGWKIVMAPGCRLAPAAESKEREAHFARVLGVCDGGQYRNDWDTRITAALAERDHYEPDWQIPNVRSERTAAFCAALDVAIEHLTGGHDL